MKIITVDFETFYGGDLGFAKQTTEEYVRDPRFEVIGAAVQVDDEEPTWFSGTMKETAAFLNGFDWANNLALAHNAVFDGFILSHHFGIKPKGWLDTLSMGRALHGTNVGGSLKVLSEFYGIGEKGTEVQNFINYRRETFTEEELASYGAYCVNDVVLTRALFKCMNPEFPKAELRLIDLTVKMFTEPVLQLDTQVLEAHLTNVRAAKEAALGAFNKDDLMSNPKLADLLRAEGVEPPMKISPTTGKETYAFSKTDEGFKALLEHENPRAQAIVAARLGVKSTIEETRTERFIGIAGRGPLPVPLRYYAAHTGRWGGDDKVNLQNLPRTSPLKHAILAPAGMLVVDSDSSQIEARTLAWLAGQDDLVESFDRGEDVYKIMASAIYGKDVAAITKEERFVGKTTILGCISEGTLVLSDLGWKPIEQVSTTDKLWDGEEWVCHQGLVNSGTKETLSLCGTWLTPDHRVWSGTQWLEAQYLVRDANTRSLALGIGAENLPLQATLRGNVGALSPSWLRATAARMSTAWTARISRISRVLGAIYARRNHPQIPASSTGGIPLSSQTTSIGSGCLTAFQRASDGATRQAMLPTITTVGGVLLCSQSGGLTGGRSLPMFRPSLGGMYQSMNLIGLTLTEGMNRAISGLSRAVQTLRTSEKSQTLRRRLQTYDLAYAGPRNRYTILTKQGPLVVHNCGYGMGAAKFQGQLKNFGVEVTLEETKRIIDTYRNTYPKITALWKAAAGILPAIMGNQTSSFGRGDLLKVEGEDGIRLPNGLYLRYPNLRKVHKVRNEDEGKTELVYDTKKGKAVIPNRIYGGKVVENVCQALARIIIGDQMLMVAKKYRVVMTVHDAIACIAPKEEVATAREYVELCMRIRPTWGPELPLNCESGYGESYGDC